MTIFARMLIAGIAVLVAGACGSVAKPSGTPPPTSSFTETSSSASTEDPHLTYVALGDSLLYALEQDCDSCTSAVVLYGQHIQDALGVPVEVHNLTMHNGLNSSGLLDYLQNGAKIGRTQEDVLTAVASADVISVTIGYNDVAFTDGARSDELVKIFEGNLDKILGRIDTLRAGKPTMIRVTTIYNNGIASESALDPDGAGTGINFWKPIVETQNATICTLAIAHNAACVDIYHAFNGPDGTSSPTAKGYLADGVHPSQLGMDTIATALAAAGYAPLQ
jgi:lysophospholipase L1-like esterase